MQFTPSESDSSLRPPLTRQKRTKLVLLAKAVTHKVRLSMKRLAYCLIPERSKSRAVAGRKNSSGSSASPGPGGVLMYRISACSLVTLTTSATNPLGVVTRSPTRHRRASMARESHNRIQSRRHSRQPDIAAHQTACDGRLQNVLYRLSIQR